MSPKKKQSSGVRGGLFRFVDQEINERKFKVIVPECFSPVPLPQYFIDNNIPPIFQPSDLNKTKSVLTPFQIIRAIYEENDVEFFSGKDMLEVDRIIKQYREAMGPYMNQMPELKHVIEMIDHAVDVLHKPIAVARRKREGMSEKQGPSSLKDLLDQDKGSEL